MKLNQQNKMKLNQQQINRLIEYNWDVVENEDGQNCSWLEVNKNNNEVYDVIIDLFGLTGENDSVKLLVVATQEEG